MTKRAPIAIDVLVNGKIKCGLDMVADITADEFRKSMADLIEFTVEKLGLADDAPPMSISAAAIALAALPTLDNELLKPHS